MKKILVLLITVTVINVAFGQKTEQSSIFGSWKLISVENINADGSKIFPYGSDPRGILFFDDKGNYSIQIYKNGRLKIISGDKNKCTPEENASIVQGSNSHFGQYEFDETNKTIIFKIKTASFPNWENTEQKRSYSFDNDLLEYVVTNTTQGGKSVKAVVIWKKM